MQDTTNFKKWQTILPGELILIIFTNFDTQKGSWTLLDYEWLTLTNILYKKLTNNSKNSFDRETLLTLDTDICRFHTDVNRNQGRNIVQNDTILLSEQDPNCPMVGIDCMFHYVNFRPKPPNFVPLFGNTF